MEILKTISLSLFQGVYILLYAFLIFYISKSNLKKFISIVLIIGSSATIIGQLIVILSFRLNVEIIRDLFYYTSDDSLPDLSFILNFLYPFGAFLVITGITFTLSKNYPNNEIQNIELVGSKRSIGVSIFLFVITLGLYFPFWLYRTVKDLEINFNNEVPYSPSKAVGFLFIPIFNIYWFIYLAFSLPNVIHKIEEKHFNANIGFTFQPLLISFFLLFIPILSNLYYFANINESEIFGQIFGEQLFFFAALIYLWIIIQAKINAFFDFNLNEVK